MPLALGRASADGLALSRHFRFRTRKVSSNIISYLKHCQQTSPSPSFPFLFVSMSLGASRAALRRSQLILSRGSIRRATTASEAAGTAKEQASEATSKASQGLSRVASSAGSAISTAGSATNDAVARLSKRAGSIVGFANCKFLPPLPIELALHASHCEMRRKSVHRI